MTFTALAHHKKLLKKEGFDPKSDDYYEEINGLYENQFPSKFEKQKRSNRSLKKEKAPQTVAGTSTNI